MPKFLGSWLDRALQSLSAFLTVGAVAFAIIGGVGAYAALVTGAFARFAPYSYVVAILLVMVLSIPVVAALLVSIRWLIKLREPARQEHEHKRQAEIALLRRLEAWDPTNILTLREAACLWNEEDPLPLADLVKDFKDTQGRAKALETQLLRAIQDGRLRLKSVGSGGPYIELTRADLVAYAETTNQRPLFLFPDARPQPRR